MEGNFLSRYNNKLDFWKNKIEDDPDNKCKHETDMSNYIIKCLPYMNQYTDDTKKDVSTDNIFNCKETSGLQRKDIFTDYLVEVENLNVDRPLTKNPEKCPNCVDSILFHFTNTGDLVCQGCGLIISTLISEELTYREEQETSEKIVNYSYKRENHFNEWLSQFQAQETTNIPLEVIDQLKNELKKIKIKKVEEITHARVRSLLKKLKLNKYYDCPSERKNFLSYSYVLYKFCELLSEDKYLKYFPLLKSKEKLYHQDLIWNKICKTLQWEYIATI